MWKPLKLAPWFIAASAAWSFGFVYNVVYGGELSFLKNMYFHKKAVAAQLDIDKPRRLIITGGSGANYSINSPLIEQGLGIPVINLGLDGPVGLNVILPTILESVRPGDVVLLIPEDLILLDEDGILDRSAPFGIAIGKPMLGDIPLKHFVQEFWLQGIPTLKALTKSGIDLFEKGKLTGYYSDPFTDHGDPTVVKYRKGKWWKRTIDKPVSPHAIARITQFRDELKAKGATLILSLPWFYASTDPKSVKNMQKTADELSQIAPLIYDHKTLNMKTDSRLFADTHHHLVPEAKKLRAKQIIEELKPILEKL